MAAKRSISQWWTAGAAALLLALAAVAGGAPPERTGAGRALLKGAAIRSTGADLADPEMEYVPGEVLVKFRDGAAPAAAALAAQSIGARVLHSFSNIGTLHWRLDPGTSVEQAL